MATAGMVTVTRVLGGKPASGVKTALSPRRCHVPAIAGDRDGNGAPAGSGAL